jgi:hypothetical protein
MKQAIFFLLAVGFAASLHAQVQLPEHRFGAGNWSIDGGRVFQNDETARMARVNVRAAQSGSMLYEFNVRYESGSEDGHGGFGIHIFVDSIFEGTGSAWGAGNSYLLWLNYDENPNPNSNVPAGLSGQVYRSRSHFSMELLYSIDLNRYADLLTKENLSKPITFRIWVNGDTGEVRVYDPTDPYLSTYYYFNVPQGELPLRGDWVVLRTNGLSLSFAPDSLD